MNYQSKVEEFQRASGQPVSDTPRELTKEEYDFRDNLLREEIRELQYAIVDNNRVEILDALCDIKYVNDGTANQKGFIQNDSLEYIQFNYIYSLDNDSKLDWSNKVLNQLNNILFTDYVDIINSCVFELASCFGFTLENFKTALNRVHESNMSKFCNDIKTAERTREFYAKQGIDTYIEPKEKKFVVYRQGDGKVLKSVEYYPVYLEDLV